MAAPVLFCQLIVTAPAVKVRYTDGSGTVQHEETDGVSLLLQCVLPDICTDASGS